MTRHDVYLKEMILELLEDLNIDLQESPTYDDQMESLIAIASEYFPPTNERKDD